MRKNEPDATQRVATPIPFRDLDGQLKPNLTFATAGGEVFVYKSSTNTWVAANADAVELGGANASGTYKVQFTQAEVNYDTLVGVKLVKAGYSDQFWFEKIDGSTADRVAGLLHRNAMVDMYLYDDVNNPAEPSSFRVRVFADAAALAGATPDGPDDDDDEIYRYLGTSTFNVDGTLATYQLVEDL